MTEFPQHVWNAVKRIPPLNLDTVRFVSNKRVSVILPITFDATVQYNPTQGYGWASLEHADVSVPGIARVEPTAPTFPDDLGYIMYRVDDITQELDDMLCTLTPGLGSEYGIAIYNFGFGNSGIWEPMYWGGDPDPLIDLGPNPE